MKIGNIAYINLLPFRVFLKQRSKTFSGYLQSTRFSDYPARMNELFHKRRIEASFISAVKATRTTKTNSGINAKGAVKSVIVKPGSSARDHESATSNVLARILGIEGEVYIGDKALRRYIDEPSSYVDLGEKWHERTGLPFVFGRLCFNTHGNFYRKLSREFNRWHTALPAYIVAWEANKKGFSSAEIRWYLRFITYTIGQKEERGFCRFMKLAAHV